MLVKPAILTTFTTTIRTVINDQCADDNMCVYRHVHICMHVHVVINNALSSSERRLRSSPWERNFLFPLCFLTLLAMTVMALFLVTTNTLQLLYNRASVISVQVRHCTCIYVLGTFTCTCMHATVCIHLYIVLYVLTLSINCTCVGRRGGVRN